MQLDLAMYRRYQQEAPDLLAAVAADGSGDHIMRRDAKTDYCVRFEDGICGIHKQRGSGFLGDACHFYPRVTRRLGNEVLMTATPSCPEVARLALFEEDAFVLRSMESERLPYSLKDYLPDEMDSTSALSIHRAFMQAAGADDVPFHQVFARISSVARSLERLPHASWPDAVPFYLKSADGRLGAPEQVAEDPFNLLHVLCGLIVATQKPRSERLQETLTCMERALHVSLDWDTVLIQTQPDSLSAWHAVKQKWHSVETGYDALFKRALQLQLSIALFPFAGLGGTVSERITLIGVRLATFRLAIMCAHSQDKESLTQEAIVRIAQSLARVLDHLADPAFSLAAFQEAGWTKEYRIQSLVNI